jgi:acetyl esterase/lipase
MTTQAKDLIHPEYREWLELIELTASAPAPTLENLSTLRAAPNPYVRVPLEHPPFVRQIPVPNGAPDVAIYVINAAPAGSSGPAILHTHGGGFIFFGAESALANLQEIAAALDCVIVTVDYRLAPETPFPGSLEDNYAGLKWLHAHAEELGADRNRIAVMGESAGGGHAAMLAIAARDRGEVPLIFQALIYPMLDDRTGSTNIPPAHVGSYVWRCAENKFAWTSFLGQPAGSAEVVHGSVPARVEDLTGLPPTYIAVGSLDLFVDEDIAYAQRLMATGVSVELHVYPGCIHAFDFLPTATAAAHKAALLKALCTAFG